MSLDRTILFIMNISNPNYAKAALEKVLNLVDSQADLANRLGLPGSTVRNWPLRGRVPPHECVAVSIAVEGQVSVLALMGYEPVDVESVSNVSITRESNAACS